MDAMRKRYHEEQIWNDRWRVLGVYGTWGLIALNSVLFLGVLEGGGEIEADEDLIVAERGSVGGGSIGVVGDNSSKGGVAEVSSAVAAEGRHVVVEEAASDDTATAGGAQIGVVAVGGGEVVNATQEEDGVSAIAALGLDQESNTEQ
eukprot:CAMPEP_0178601730 /NCGR_PEP_ID=MMETSP0697-20121206/34548_1 /TAXON_ID=265572 /ORGANISM="Extubocellulus spinifer, Strain CCMP396" /LENGTH=146 /DNA_ID=CAMNT_0020239817 /DNA_START=1 /DNA_END=439 /DNA_ORIENTATION=-